MTRIILSYILFLSSCFKNYGQVVNYINNGSFEEILTNTSTPLFYSAKFWGGIDSTKYYGELLSRTTSPIKVPLSSYTYQWPKHGNNHLLTTPYSTFLYNNRGYPRNRLKEKLVAGKAYCFSMYVNLSNNSTIGIDAIAGYFSDQSIDTITHCNNPITYLTPQVENTFNNIVSDTLNWVLIRGQFTANGTEKYVLLGNFRNNINTNTVIANSTHSPVIASDYLIDYVSLIELNLPAFAGRDTSVTPGANVFIGRQPDVGIDEACVWYKLPITTPIDTVAGFWVNPTSTSTYVVVQTICGLIKSDTVVVHMNLVGITELKINNTELKIYPQPADDYLLAELTEVTSENYYFKIINNLGQIIKEEEIVFKDKTVRINTKELENGLYHLIICNSSNEKVIKKLLIAK